MQTYNYKGFKIEIEDDKLLNDNLKSRLSTYNWESSEVAALVHLPEDSSVLELGGCLGIVSLFIGKKLSDPSKHIVLEPNPKLLGPMEKIKRDNNAQYTILNNFLGPITDEVRPFSLHPNHVMGGRLGKVYSDVVDITGKKFTDLEQEHNIKFDSIIMDIEGGEYGLYQEKFFEPSLMNRIKFLMIELHPHSQKTQLRSYLQGIFEKEIVIAHSVNNSVLVYLNE